MSVLVKCLVCAPWLKKAVRLSLHKIVTSQPSMWNHNRLIQLDNPTLFCFALKKCSKLSSFSPTWLWYVFCETCYLSSCSFVAMLKTFWLWRSYDPKDVCGGCFSPSERPLIISGEALQHIWRRESSSIPQRTHLSHPLLFCWCLLLAFAIVKMSSISNPGPSSPHACFFSV